MMLMALLVSVPSPSPSQGPDPDSVTPGLTGFLATFALVVVSLLLFASMVRRLRRMQYRAEHEGMDDGAAGEGAAGEAPWPAADERRREPTGDSPDEPPDPDVAGTR